MWSSRSRSTPRPPGQPAAHRAGARARGDLAPLGRVARGGSRRRPGPFGHRPRHPPAPAPPHHEALGARVLTESGDERGTVRDIAFDPATGRIEEIRTTSGEFPGELLMGLGDYALVVRTG
ncbi:PRC-barrel domain-containing protein [Streptomyces kaempferi]